VVLEWIRDGLYAYEINRVRRILAQHGKADYDRAKAHLQAFTFGGRFFPKRGNAYLQQHSGLIWCDLDNLDDIAATKRAICSDPRTVCLFTSPSGIGLKAGIHGPIVVDDKAYKYVWNAVRVEYERLYGVPWDPSGKDISRLCYASYDPDLYWNPDAVCFDVPPSPAPEPRPQPYRPSILRSHTNHQDYAARAIATATEMIQSAVLGGRHHARLRASRLLGGYVSSGLLRYEEALSALSRALEGHTDDMGKALSTVVAGLHYGEAYPIKPEDLEAERQAWIDAHRPTIPTTRQAPVDDDPWEGTRTLPTRPYTGYRGYSGYRAYRAYRS
jgi:hypothetical protein